jgi:uncharacterized protein (DUF2062 family)
MQGNSAVGTILLCAFVGSAVVFVILWFTWGKVLRDRRDRRMAKLAKRRAESLELATLSSKLEGS